MCIKEKRGRTGPSIAMLCLACGFSVYLPSTFALAQEAGDAEAVPALEPSIAPDSSEAESLVGQMPEPEATSELNGPLTHQGASVAELESDSVAREALMKDVFAYQDRIQEIERTQGAFAAGLTEQLLGMGLVLQRNGDHQAAIRTFKRGVHLARVNEGLYSTRQMALLEGEIASHVALGEFSKADERQRYLFRVQAETLSDATRGQALMQHALWQRQAYEQGVGEEPFARLLRMWSLYRVALSEYAQVEGESSTRLLPPLYGMLQSQYLVSGFVGEMSDGRFRTRGLFQDEEAQQLAYRNQSFKQGSSVIGAIYDIETAQPGASWEQAAETSLMLADWQLWHKKRSDALETYATLYRELEASEAAQVWRKRVFDTPAPLPQIVGVRALPDSIEEQAGALLLEFSVTERGRVVDLERLDSYASNDKKASEIVRRIKQTLFRPRFSDGMPVRTEGLRWAYDTAEW